MLRRSLLRIVVALALSLLLLGLFSGFNSPGSNKFMLMAEKAKSSLGLGRIHEDNWDELADFRPLLARLKSGDKRFDWSEWLDFDKTKLYDTNDLDPKLYPYLNSLNLAERPIMPYEKTTSPQEQAMIGRLYCKWLLTAPSRVVAIRDPMLHDPPSESESDLERNHLASTKSLRNVPLNSYEVVHAIPDLRHRQYGHDQPTPFKEVSEPLVSDLKAPASDLNIEDLLFPRVDSELFTWEAKHIVNQHVEGSYDHGLTVHSCLGYNTRAKHFHEVWIRDDPVGYGVHYDWRFFRGILPHNEHLAALHTLGRSWQQFAEQMGITYWYAHGSLMGHLWNSMAMPWDSDHDVQMPIQELNRLASDFNRTLVVQDPEEGFRKYLIDVNPEYVVRSRGMGKNVIDARFIDVDTGLYIDITGLARNAAGRKLVSCKNRHQYRASDFSRLRRTNFEGFSALVPADTHSMLQKEYPFHQKPRFGHWEFVYSVRLWEFHQPCKDYLEKYKGSIHIYCFPSDIKNDDGCQAEFGTCDKETLRVFELTKDITSLALKEAAIYKDIPSPLTTSAWNDSTGMLNQLLETLGKYHPSVFASTALVLDEPKDPAFSEST